MLTLVLLPLLIHLFQAFDFASPPPTAPIEVPDLKNPGFFSGVLDVEVSPRLVVVPDLKRPGFLSTEVVEGDFNRGVSGTLVVVADLKIPDF
jgi:hypothetical protein